MTDRIKGLLLGSVITALVMLVIGLGVWVGLLWNEKGDLEAELEYAVAMQDYPRADDLDMSYMDARFAELADLLEEYFIDFGMMVEMESGVAGTEGMPASEPESSGVIDPAAYTKDYVAAAIAMYEGEGAEATFEYYNSSDSVHGEWYLFVSGADERIVVHGLNKDMLGVESRTIVTSDGFEIGIEGLKAPEEGMWIEGLLWPHPVTGEETLKNWWLIRHDGLIFGSGWYGE